ncbi:hypothetical protein GCM10023165_42300 [Variovorax defluvii]|uniref:DUF3025 domain-containing protein n=1 Tax=Variovorax defluvii TaxID=913761 RepID=A0ABP8I7I8_9BURK
MSAAVFAEGVDAGRPWLAPYALPDALAGAASVAEALNRRRTGEVRFVPQAALPAGEAYEQFIFRTRCVPTRDNLHDFFNGLVWLHCPLAKRQLNALQAESIERDGVGAVRGPLRDAATLFDENGAVLDAPPALWEALLARDWHRLFVTQRAMWCDARLRVFGHALLEQLARAPRKALTAHVLRAPGDVPAIAVDDAAIAAALQAGHLATKPFTPLPVLGVPGWWPANEAPGFYADAAVFRPPRSPLR